MRIAALAGPGDLMAVKTVDPGALEEIAVMDLEEIVAAPTLTEITATLVLVVVPAEAPLQIYLIPTKRVQMPTGPTTRRRLG